MDDAGSRKANEEGASREEINFLTNLIIDAYLASKGSGFRLGPIRAGSVRSHGDGGVHAPQAAVGHDGKGNAIQKRQADGCIGAVECFAKSVLLRSSQT